MKVEGHPNRQRCHEDSRVRVLLERDHRGFGPGRAFAKLSKENDVNVESRKAMSHLERTIFCTLREKDNLIRNK